MFIQKNKEAQDVTEVSYEIANLIAKHSKAFSEGDFIKKCILLAAQKLSPDVLKKFENISLNRMTVQRRIVDLSGDIVDQLKEKSKQFVYFSLATDESTDVTSTAQLLVFVRGVTEDFSIHEELVGLSSLKGQTTGSDLLNGLLEQISVIELDLDKLVGISTDGAPAMIGKQNGLVQLLIKHLGERKYELKQFHCIIHQQNLCGKELDFDHVMKVVVSTVNFIKSRSALHHRQFKQFLDEIEAEYGDLVFCHSSKVVKQGKYAEKIYQSSG
ncbi:general transcription factor II-I repeat domain-containing protein 2A-like [Macrobrachium nipponense]|uniref:general transcription factor II-I repeat domain-containing protein 2A-like n=1 Tax=Macrobrachium nipponense TaxID=159736 RepID=UPI0030C7B369